MDNSIICSVAESNSLKILLSDRILFQGMDPGHLLQLSTSVVSKVQAVTVV